MATNAAVHVVDAEDKSSEEWELLPTTKDLSSTMPVRGPTPWLENLRFKLSIETTDTTTAPQTGSPLHKFEKPDSKIVSITTSAPSRYNDDDDAGVTELTSEEMQAPGFVGNKLVLHSDSCDLPLDQCAFTNERGYFTIEEMLRNIAAFEKLDRAHPSNMWFGGIDPHHYFYKGISYAGETKDGDSRYTLNWRS
eukprot:scpid93731/ scgid14542/ 